MNLSYKIFALSLIVVGLSACSTRLPPAGVAAYDQCNYDKAIETFSKTKVKDKDALLFDLAILSSAVHKGDREEVKRSGLRAQQRMWGYEGAGKGTASLISSEAIRIYKGEPFEKSMASMYLGIVYFNEGDYENAKAAFTKAMFAMQIKGDDTKADFAAPFVLLAKAYIKLKDDENARIVLGRLEKGTGIKLELETLKNIKTIAFVEMGRGPKKVRTGPGASLIAWQRQSSGGYGATLYVDGKTGQDVVLKDDLKYQAESVNRGGKETIQGTKGVLREASTITAIIAANEAVNRKNETAGWVALGAGLFAIANQSQADIRQWEMLPDRLQMIMANAPENEGRHQFAVDFGSGFYNYQNLSSPAQVWYDERKTDLDQIYVVRSNSCAGKKI
jgi:tetratricopeptide (TPR) repeat protein